MKYVFVNVKGWDRQFQKEAVSVDFMEIGKGILHLTTKDGDYYFPLEMVVSCVVRNYD